MNLTRVSAIAALLGGLVWVLAAAVDWGHDVNPVVYVVGLVWSLVALAVVGYSLVHHAPVWLRAVVSVATPALGYMVWVAWSDSFGDDALPVLLAGLVLVAAGGWGIARHAPETTPSTPVRGRRAAR